MRIHLQPGATRESIRGLRVEPDGQVRLRVAVTAAPEGGKANVALIKYLAGLWGLSKSRLSIRAGTTDRRKTVFIEGDNKALTTQLTGWLKNARHTN